MPETASRWDSPLARNARSSSAARSLSPRTSARAIGPMSGANVCVDAAADPRAHAVDPGEEPPCPAHRDDVERPPGADDAAVRLRGAGVAPGRVPQALRRSQGRHDVGLVATRQVVGPAVERRFAAPVDRVAVADEAVEVRVPPQDVPRAHGRRVDPGVRCAVLRQAERGIRPGARRLVERHRVPGADRACDHRRDCDGHHARPSPALGPKKREEDERRGRDGDGRDEEKRSPRERRARKKDDVDRTVHGVDGALQHRACPARARRFSG